MLSWASSLAIVVVDVDRKWVKYDCEEPNKITSDQPQVKFKLNIKPVERTFTGFDKQLHAWLATRDLLEVTTSRWFCLQLAKLCTAMTVLGSIIWRSAHDSQTIKNDANNNVNWILYLFAIGGLRQYFQQILYWQYTSSHTLAKSY